MNRFRFFRPSSPLYLRERRTGSGSEGRVRCYEERINVRSRATTRRGKRVKRKHRQSGSDLNNKEPVQPRTRRVMLIAAPGTEILDLVGPFQVFARAAEMFSRQNPRSAPIYSVEVITTSRQRSVVTNGGLRLAASHTS